VRSGVVVNRVVRGRRGGLVAVVLFAALLGSAVTVVPAEAAPAAPDVTDAESAPDSASALEIAQRYGHRVTVASSLTENTSVAVLPDGTEELTISSGPVRVLQDGEWAPIDTTLHETPGGMFAPAATETPVEFSGGGAGPLARVMTPTGEWVSFAPPVSTLPEPVVEDDSVTYPQVLPGVDLRLSATESGMSEVLVIQSAEAAAHPDLQNLTFVVSGAHLQGGSAQDSAAATAADGSVVVSATPT
jgi:hypothetical protein